MIGRPGYPFQIDESGWIRAVPRPDGSAPVIAGQFDLAEVAVPDEWAAVDEATGNNTRISDGEEFYPGAEFDRTLIDGQVHDVMRAIAPALHDYDYRTTGSPPITSGRLLEVGCGPGFLLEALQEELPGWTMVGVDPSPVSCRQAQARGVDVREGTLESVDLGEAFDAVVLMGNFHLHRDPAATLRQVAAVIRSGGALYLDSKNPRSLARVLARWLVSSPLGRVGAVQGFAAHAFHGLRHCIPKRALRDLLVETGWQPLEVCTVGPRLLRFGNRHALASGWKGRAWQVLDRADGLFDERAWLQVVAVRDPRECRREPATRRPRGWRRKAS